MPHEIIMPALGMTQDTGLIVSWLKQAGDAVKTGDALFEVETDKATMEVEAQADGFLTDVKAAAGDNVPVGQVIALISETSDASAKDDPQSKPETTTGETNDEPDGHQVIMPALGMTQDTGLIINWLKQPGDQVAADDVLLEVETDKSTMEVPAGHDGYIAAILAEAGENVPVGKSIAVISAKKPAAPFSRASVSQGKPPKSEKAEQPAPQTSKMPQQTPRPVAGTGRILASPKAKRLAKEQGLDLAQLVAKGMSQPFHVSDLETLKALPARVEANQRSGFGQRLSARVKAKALTEFMAMIADESGAEVSRSTILASFAAAAFRKTTGASDITVSVENAVSDAVGAFHNPDTVNLAEQPDGNSEHAPDLILRDLIDTAIGTVCLGPETLPVMTVSRIGKNTEITLECSMENRRAITLVNEFAERLNDPVRHLL